MFLQKYLMALLYIFNPILGKAQNSQPGFCESLDGIEQIETYLLCQSEPKILACAGLGALLASGAGASLRGQNIRVRNQITEGIKERLIAAYQPNYGVRGVKVDPAAEGKARFIAKRIQKARLSGRPLDQRFITDLQEDIKKVPSLFGPKDVESFPGILRSAVATAEELELKNNSGIGGAIRKTLSKLGPKSALVAGGAAGAVVAVGGEILTTPNLACATLDFMYMNHDNCQPVFKIDQRVAQFLELPAEEKLKTLKVSSQLCDYYQNLHRKLMPPMKSLEIECQGKGKFEMAGVLEDGRKLSYRSSSDPKTGRLRQVSMSLPPNLRQFRLTQDGTVSPFDVAGETAAADYLMTRIHIPVAHECCVLADEQQAQCLQKYNQSNEPLQNSKSSTNQEATL